MVSETTVGLSERTRDRLKDAKYDFRCDTYDSVINQLLESHGSEDE